MGRIWFVPLLLAAWVCGAETVHACSCTPRSTSCGPPGEFWRASDVFSARVLRIERGSPTERRIEVQIIERWRGSVSMGGTVAVFTRSVPVCGYPFRQGLEYLIYASRSEDGRLTTGVCSGTAPLEGSEAAVRYARTALNHVAPPGRIVGHVRLSSKGRPRQGIGNVAVSLRQAQGVNTTTTDESGRYAFELSTMSARYQLEVAVPETYYVNQPRQIIELPDPRACVERDIDVQFNGRISGRVSDARGRGVAGLPIVHVPLSDVSHNPGRRTVLTRDDGSFEIDRLPPGQFEAQIEIPIDSVDGSGESSQNDTVFRITRGVLGGGERRSVEPFIMPSTVEIARVEGVVVGADGWSMADARVFLRGETGERLLGVPAMTDALGRFVLTVADGERYQIFAERPSGESEFSEPISITAGRVMAPLRLVVRRRF